MTGCYVGLARLNKAIAQASTEGTAVTATFRPYMIDARCKREGEPYMAYMRRRWGGDGWVGDLKRRGAPDGCAFGNWKWWPHTHQAHRLMLFVEGLRDPNCTPAKVKLALLRAAYEEGQNISLLEPLLGVAVACGVPDAEACRAYLADVDGAGYDEVLRLDEEAKRMKVSGVPFFLVEKVGGTARPTSLSGAHPASAFVQLFRELA